MPHTMGTGIKTQKRNIFLYGPPSRGRYYGVVLHVHLSIPFHINPEERYCRNSTRLSCSRPCKFSRHDRHSWWPLVQTNPFKPKPRTYVLAPVLPDKTESHYNLNSTPHDRQLIPKLIKLYDSNFIVHMLYKQVY